MSATKLIPVRNAPSRAGARSDTPLLVKFEAQWCGRASDEADGRRDCRRVLGRLTVATVDIEDNQQTCTAWACAPCRRGFVQEGEVFAQKVGLPRKFLAHALIEMRVDEGVLVEGPRPLSTKELQCASTRRR